MPSDATPNSSAAAPADAEERTPLTLPQVPLAARSLSLVILATLASIFMLHWARDIFIPLAVGIMFSYGLSPVVDWLQLRRIPRALSSALLISSLLGGLGSAAYFLSDDASKLVETLPVATQKLRIALQSSRGKSENTLDAVQKAAAQLEKAAEESGGSTQAIRGVQRVVIEKPKFSIRDYVWSGTLSLLGMLSQVGLVALFTFFLMSSGDRFRRKLIGLVGPALSSKRVTLQALNEVHHQIQRYMLVQLFTSALVGVATWLCFAALGLEHAAVWGIAAGILNLVPYIGGTVIAAGSALVAFMQFGTLDMALVVAGASIIIHSIEGFFLTPWLTSRTAKMSPVAVFVGVLAWGWLWGAWGLLLGVPILMVIKAVCDRVDGLKPVGEFLGA
jgi:predicted PurR-regulated permease PerM